MKARISVSARPHLQLTPGNSNPRLCIQASVHSFKTATTNFFLKFQKPKPNSLDILKLHNYNRKSYLYVNRISLWKLQAQPGSMVVGALNGHLASLNVRELKENYKIPGQIQNLCKI